MLGVDISKDCCEMKSLYIYCCMLGGGFSVHHCILGGGFSKLHAGRWDVYKLLHDGW